MSFTRAAACVTLLTSLSCNPLAEPPPTTPPPNPPTPPADPYAELPDATPVGDTITVGPDGARADFGGFVLEVPRGALSEDVEIQAAPIPSPPSIYDAPLAPVIRLLPAGLYFKRPVRLSIELNEDPPPPVPGARGFFVTTTPYEVDNPDDTPDEEVAVLDVQGRIVRVLIWHFSEVAVYPMPGAGPTVQDMTAVCNTAPIAALSDEIRRVLMEFGTVDLAPLPIGDGIVSQDPALPPYLSAAAVASVLTAVDAPAAGPDPLQVNSAWRSVAQQFLLSRCNNANATANVGNSFHIIGAAVDVQGDFSSCDETTTRDDLHPIWGAPLEDQAGFNWFGNNNGPCGDKPHFTHGASASAPRGDAVLAFQMLWNRRNPCAPVPDVELGERAQENLPFTLEAIGASPAAGFGSTGPVSLPVEGGGCGSETPMCCPGVDDEPAFCAESCPTPDAGLVDAGDYDGGDYDAGDYDAGDYDAGDYDAGDYDAGDYDAGDYDAGDYDADAGVNDAGIVASGPPYLFSANATYSSSAGVVLGHGAGQQVDGFAGDAEITLLGPPGNVDPRSVALDGSGNLWVAGCTNPELNRYDAAQLVPGDISPTPPVAIDLEGVNCAMDIAFDANGRLYIATNGQGLGVLEPAQLTTSGTVAPILIALPGGSAEGANYINSVVAGLNGDIWALHNLRIKRYAVSDTMASGNPTPLAVWESGVELDTPGDLVFDASGFLWITSRPANSLLGYDATAQSSTTTPAPTRIVTSAGLEWPEAAAFDSDGNLWVSNWDNNTLTMFTAADLAVGGDVAPAATVTGPLVEAPYKIAFDPPAGSVFAP